MSHTFQTCIRTILIKTYFIGEQFSRVRFCIRHTSESVQHAFRPCSLLLLEVVYTYGCVCVCTQNMTFVMSLNGVMCIMHLSVFQVKFAIAGVTELIWGGQSEREREWSDPLKSAGRRFCVQYRATQ